MVEQIKLQDEQIEAFHSDTFTDQQVADFCTLVGNALPGTGSVVDVGGGCGHFAGSLNAKTGLRLRIIDTDAKSVETCRALYGSKVEANVGDALAPAIRGDEQVACFNLMLHHMVANTESGTRVLQKQALAVWREKVSYVFVNEYIYDSFIGNASGWLIYQITSSQALSFAARLLSKVIPSLRANTFGTGVRFRAHAEWKVLFNEAGFDVARVVRGEVEPLPLPRRVLLIQAKRRDSYLLVPREGTAER